MVVVRTLLALVGVCALAWVVLTLLSRRGIGVAKRSGRLQVLERVALSPRRQLYLVRADERVLLLGGSETGALSVLVELPAEPGGPQVSAAELAKVSVLPTQRGA